MDFIMDVLLFIGCCVAGVGGIYVLFYIPEITAFVKDTHLVPSEIKRNRLERRVRKAEESRLDSIFTGYSEGAKFLLDSRGYYHLCSRKKCSKDSEYSEHYFAYAKSFAQRDYKRIMEQGSINDDNIDDILSHADLFHKKRLKEAARMGEFDIAEITDSEWKLIIKEYNEQLIELARKDTDFSISLDAAKMNNQNSLKIDFYVESERLRLSAMTAEDLKNESWYQQYENA